jgi:hypothetical protein
MYPFAFHGELRYRCHLGEASQSKVDPHTRRRAQRETMVGRRIAFALKRQENENSISGHLAEQRATAVLRHGQTAESVT